MLKESVYKKLEISDLNEASELVWRVFNEFVAPKYLDEGIEVFRKFIDVEQLTNNVNAGNIEMYGCLFHDKIIGTIALKKPNHICLFFVDKQYHGQGIAKHLFGLVKDNVNQHFGNEYYITVNSSPYAVEMYKHLGFKAFGEEQVKDGIRFTPMRYDNQN